MADGPELGAGVQLAREAERRARVLDDVEVLAVPQPEDDHPCGVRSDVDLAGDAPFNHAFFDLMMRNHYRGPVGRCTGMQYARPSPAGSGGRSG